MDWQYIETVLKVGRESKGDRAEEVFRSLAHLEDEFGREWIENIWPFPPGNSFIEDLVEFEKSLRITDVVKNGQRLRQKLVSAVKKPIKRDKRLGLDDVIKNPRLVSREMRQGFHSPQARDAMAEAQVAIILVESGAELVYEPELPDESRKPDFIATWGREQVAFEVTNLELSAQDIEQWEGRQTYIGQQCGKLISHGGIDVYLMEPEISKKTERLILQSVQEFAKTCSNTDYYECQVSKTAFWVYEPTGKPHSLHDALPPMVSMAYISIQRMADGSQNSIIVRVHRTALDCRVMGKVLDKASQLPSRMPGVIVIYMSATTGNPDEWSDVIRRNFGFPIHSEISAVWLRSAVGTATGFEWTSKLILNPHAADCLANEIGNLFLASERRLNPDVGRSGNAGMDT